MSDLELEPEEPDIDYDTPAEPIEFDTAEAREKIDEHLRRIQWWETELMKSADVYQAQKRAIAAKANRLEAWSKAEAERVNKRIAYHAVVVKGYLAARLRTDKKLRSVRLPHGRLMATVPQKPRLSIVDQDALDAWVLAHHRGLYGEPKGIGITAIKTIAVVADNDDGYTVYDPKTEQTIPGVKAELEAPKYDYDTSDPRELF